MNHFSHFKLPVPEFLKRFRECHYAVSERPFCFILGAGASKESGIPTGGELVERWLKELHAEEDFQERPPEEWATAQNLKIEGFDYKNAAHSYPDVYVRRYKDPDHGYAFQESIMAGKEPSIGYLLLAQVLATTKHKVVVTTNFDNLVPDALAIYTKGKKAAPLVVGHERLASFIPFHLAQVNRGPLVAKIHRDVLLKPISDNGTSCLQHGWKSPLTMIFKRFTPIVIGYGGNDGSLMNFLDQMPATARRGIYWCYLDENGIDEKTKDLVSKYEGHFVCIDGFDQFMFQLWHFLQLPSPVPEVERHSNKREGAYVERLEAFRAELSTPGKDAEANKAKRFLRKEARRRTTYITEHDVLWMRLVQAQEEPSLRRAEQIYSGCLKDFPDHPDVLFRKGCFLWKRRNQADKAGKMFRRVLRLQPDCPLYAGVIAEFTWKALHNFDEAERLYRRARRLDPHFGLHRESFAQFLKRKRT